MFSAALYAHARTFYPFAHETSGAARIRHSLRPLDFGGREKYLQTSGAMRRENAATYSVSSSRKRGPSIPETSVMEPRSRGVLDARLRGHDRSEWRRTIPVIASEATCPPKPLDAPKSAFGRR